MFFLSSSAFGLLMHVTIQRLCFAHCVERLEFVIMNSALFVCESWIRCMHLGQMHNRHYGFYFGFAGAEFHELQFSPAVCMVPIFVQPFIVPFIRLWEQMCHIFRLSVVITLIMDTCARLWSTSFCSSLTWSRLTTIFRLSTSHWRPSFLVFLSQLSILPSSSSQLSIRLRIFVAPLAAVHMALEDVWCFICYFINDISI